jgi:hypothetical protein
VDVTCHGVAGCRSAVEAVRPRKDPIMAKLLKQVEEFAKSPKAKELEKKMLRKAEDPKTRAKIAKQFKKFRKSS